MKKLEVISADIVKNKTLSINKRYLIDAEVHVVAGITLTIQNGVTVLIKNGEIKAGRLKRSALIFDQGSKLRARNVTFKAAGASNKVERKADNGGLWFIGNFRDASKDGISVKADRKKPVSSFTGNILLTSYLGRKDPLGKKKRQRAVDDDIDGLSVLGVGPDEWKIPTIRCHYSADDGIDLTNAHIKVNKLEVRHPTEDALNISSSRLEINKHLIVEMGEFSDPDRHIFDLETDDGAAYVEIHKHCKVNICGMFGNQLVLSSIDLPQPAADPLAVYKFESKSSQRASLVYSISED